MLSPLDLLTDGAGLHHCAGLQAVYQRGFTDTAGTRHRSGLAAKQLLNGIYPFLSGCADRDRTESRLFVNGTIIFLFAFLVNILLVKTDNAGNVLLLHHDQETIQQIKIRLAKITSA